MKEDVKKKSKKFLLTKADSISKIYKKAEEYRKEQTKRNLMVSFDYNQHTYFDQNCSSTINLENTYLAIGLMLKDEYLKISIIGNEDNYENKNNQNLSLKRAEFIRYIFIQNGIDNKRIEIIDGKNEYFFVVHSKNGNKENRRTDFEFSHMK